MPACRHPDIQRFDGFRCCLSCGETTFEDAEKPEQGSDLTASTGYQYRRLNYELGQEIRLVVLYPGKELEDITCDIIHVNLLDKPIYEAVSYTWATEDGDLSMSAKIKCRNGNIAVTRNCESVLRSLRLKGRNRKIWVDAICIDQKSILERNHQVKLMATIYTNASQVVASLTTDTSLSFERVLRLLDGSSRQSNQRQETPSRREFARFICMPYFDRVWILQEIALAKIVTLVVGKWTLRWTADTVSTLLNLCKTLDFRAPSVLRWLPSSQPEAGDLLDVLHRSRNCSATDRRDKVYALLGLVNAEVASAVPVDYSQTPSSWYSESSTGQKPNTVDSREEEQPKKQHAAEYHYNVQLEVVDRTSPATTSSESSSLWLDSLNTALQIDATGEPHFAIKPQRLPVRIHERTEPPAKTPPCLRIRAHYLDIIKKFLPMATNRRELILPRGVLDAFCNKDTCSKCLLDSFALSNLEAASHLYKTFDHTVHDSCAEPKHVERELRDEFKDVVNHLGIGSTTFETRLSMGFAKEWRIDQSIWPGDTIWALAGLAVPVILRKEQDHYILVGQCYLFRAALPFLCSDCGAEVRPWPMATKIIDIW
ncbi:hypothetical protein SNOG_00913 [Parastagonospora nodorum SN15]|uniref:Heterokaryon incompatibility domain-containing protein n=1 Tax=Phaeosphaeria nodorum (strain SN15 / ATCC MYA-4574 / FGSC 10173) TaxID=321614 RepID=Q0V501_PHANO|nr:hypothetical protein SNOG_00913 [Parastagonospora nodorum SN15]EAT92408.1 hypothetical protein SNOG_00913 [Parastagonospora nodorum SN15]